MAGENNVIGLAMQLDVTDLKAGIKEVNKVIKSSKDEFNNATAGMDKWTKSSEGLNAKLKQLGTQLDGQKKIAAGYEAEIERVKNQEGDHSAQLEILKSKLLNAQTAVKKTESAMSHYEDTLRDVTAKEKEENSTLGKLQKTLTEQKNKQAELTKEYKNAVLQYGKNSREAKDLKKQLQTLSDEIEDNEKEVAKADKAFEGLGRTLDQVAGKALEKSVKTFAKVGAGVAGLVGSFLATAEATRELRTNMGKVDTAFSEAGFSAEQAEDTYTKFYGVLGDEGQATEATALLGELANNQQDLKKWTDISTGVFAKFGDSLPVEGLIEASNETAKTGEIVGGLADALNWAGISQDDFQKKLDSCSNEQERQKLITETLSKTYGDASEAYKETNKDIIASQEAQAGLSQAMADIGAKAEPLMTQVKLLGTKLLEAFLPVLGKIIPAIQNNLPLVIGAVGTLTGAVTALSAAVAILKVKNELATVATIAKTAAEKIAAGTTKALTLAQKGLNAAMKANPIGIVITLITALVAAFVVLWNKSDAFRNFWIKLWDGVKNATKKTIDAIGKFFSACWDGIKKVWGAYASFYSGIFKGIINIFKALPSKLKEFFSKAWDGAKNIWSKATNFFSDIKDKIVNAFKSLPNGLKQFFSDAWNGIKLLWKDPKQFFTNVKDNIIGAFKDLPAKLKEVGTNLVKGLWDGIKDMTSWITGKLKSFSGDVLGGIKDFFGVHSPSTEMAEIGGYMAEGLAQGIENGADDVIKAGEKVGSGFGEGFNRAAGSSVKLDNTFDKLTSTIDKQKDKLSKLENQYKSAVLTFGESSTQANALGMQIITLSREISENELKVKDLDDSYKGLSGTLANQMRIELNNAKNSQEALIKKQNELQKAMGEAGKAGDWETVKKYGQQMLQLNTELNLTNATVEELTANLDYMNKVQNKAAEGTKTVTEEAAKQKNAYEQLIETIDNQKQKLELLKTEYESLMLGGDEANASNLAVQIKVLSASITENENKVKSLDASYNKLFNNSKNNSNNTIPDNRKGWQKWIDNLEDVLGISDDKMEKWAKGTGKYINKIANGFEGMASKIGEIFDSVTGLIDQSIDSQLSALDEKLESTKTAADAELKKINAMYDNEEISAEEYYEKKNKLEEDTKKQEQKLLKEKDRLARKQFEARKANEIATATFNGASAIIKGFAELGPIAGLINMGVQAGITAAQIATIASQKYVPMLAKGGVVNGATLAMIGENGKEAVMPLENNTGWIKELAEKLNNVMKRDMLGGLNVGVPAYAMAGKTTINNNYNQTINSPKSLTRREIYRDSKNLLALKG